ncbi:MAG: hypothetical protein CVU61_07990 [Deltaproteobacteria bacterium HGW-Deltaproteobacteria-19]|jgi:hypothetical protein|nr:MAG: hypothetical protein CVU61_07990 [Deltaproteobacteria bacterium HGW-Deltaproteobacteria-19]
MKNVLMTKSDNRLERKQWVWATIIVMAIVAGIGLMPRVGEASCFYNKVTGQPKGNFKVEFECGLFCWNTWDLWPGEHKCRPGKGGHVTINRKSQFCDRGLSVAKHGWVEVTVSGRKALVASRDENGQRIDACEFDWVK